MNAWNRFKQSLSGIGQSIVRYPLTSLWFLGITILNAVELENSFTTYSRLLFTMLTGALISIVAQHIYERYFTKQQQRWLLLGGSVFLTLLYYFTLPADNAFALVYSIRSFVLLFALFIALIWIPTIGNRHLYFHQNFLAVFKASFMTILFSGVLYLGIATILSTVNQLLFDIDMNAIIHAGNIIWCFFAPIYFLGLIPEYRGEGVAENEREDSFSVPRFLTILITYIVIPLIAVYTIILLLYLILNIGGDFWKDNLLEPLLVSYALVVIVVYLLACNIEHRFSELFRLIFPKIMLPIVLLQTFASVWKIQELGITHGRYYVILFGIFATAAGIIFSFFPRERNGWIAPILLVLAFISVTPPVDAFSVARANQESRLTQTLEENNMLTNGEVTPNANIPDGAKVIISRSVDYLARMNELDEVTYLPASFNPYFNFESAFGFQMVFSLNDEGSTPMGRNAYLDWVQVPVLPLDGADYLVNFFMSNNEAARSIEVGPDLVLEIEQGNPYAVIRLEDEADQELISADTADLFNQVFENFEGKGMMTLEDMTYVVENEQVKMTLLAIQVDEYDNQLTAEIMVLVHLK